MPELSQEAINKICLFGILALVSAGAGLERHLRKKGVITESFMKKAQVVTWAALIMIPVLLVLLGIYMSM